jgi:phosphoglycerate dehydrogenase-like enzyme
VPVPRIAIGPRPARYASDAVVAGGGTVLDVDDSAEADAVVWLSPHDAEGLRRVLATSPGVRWVQLPFAGVEAFAPAGLFGDGRTWTSAKGSYAEPVAEHALTLALAGLRHLPERVTARSWGSPKGASLYDSDVTILGGGGITEKLLDQLAPFRVRATVVRRTTGAVPGAARTVSTDHLRETLPGALVVFLALALTPETTGIIAAAELAAMDERAWLVNVARGRHVVTDDLVAALRAGAIAGAALDVTDPEPLPDGHPLWDLPNAVITPHTADWPEIVNELLGRRITTNVRRFAAGEELEGLVDPVAGY